MSSVAVHGALVVAEAVVALAATVVAAAAAAAAAVVGAVLAWTSSQAFGTFHKSFESSRCGLPFRLAISKTLSCLIFAV